MMLPEVFELLSCCDVQEIKLTEINREKKNCFIYLMVKVEVEVEVKVKVKVKVKVEVEVKRKTGKQQVLQLQSRQDRPGVRILLSILYF